jgi:hypothetical protein
VSKLGENSDLELNCWPSITPLGSVGKFADIPTFPRLAPHPATGPAVLRAPSCAMSGLRGGGPGLVGDGFALGDDALRPGDGSSGLEGGAFSLRGSTRCAGVGRMWRGGGAGDRSAATAGVPNAAIIAAATAPLIVLLSDNLAPGSSTKKPAPGNRLRAGPRGGPHRCTNLQPSGHAPLAQTIDPGVPEPRSQQPGS